MGVDFVPQVAAPQGIATAVQKAESAGRGVVPGAEVARVTIAGLAIAGGGGALVDLECAESQFFGRLQWRGIVVGHPSAFDRIGRSEARLLVIPGRWSRSESAP